jgi:hypothetical protein
VSRKSPQKWSPNADQEAALGTKPDITLAKEWGVSASSIRRQRERRGIPFLARGYVLTEEQICLLGEIPDE